jgi:hypothetical protein
MSTVKTLAEDFAGEACSFSIGNAAILEDDLIIDSFAAVTARFFNEDGRPLPSEIASTAPGPEEGHLRLEPEHFLCGPQILLSSLLYLLDVFHSSDGQLFSYGGNLRPPSFKVLLAYDRDQLRDRLPKFAETDRLDKVPLRAGAHCLQCVARVTCSRVKLYRSVRVELADEAAQLDAGPVGQPIVQDVKVEVPLPG